MKFIKGFLKKIISIITVVVVLASSLLWLVPTASAYEVDGVAYQFKLQKNVSIIPSEFIASLGRDPTQDVVFESNVMISISNGMSGTGEIGYNAAANSFYVYIYKYGVEGAYWALKYDSSGQWKYRGSAEDYTNDSSNYYNYNDTDTDIYLTIGDGYYEIDSRLTMSGIIDDTVVWLHFYGGLDPTGQAYKIFPVIGNNVTMPEMTFTRKGYDFFGWSDGVFNNYQPGKTYLVKNLCSFELTAVWEPTYVITFTGDGITESYINVPDGGSFYFPEDPVREGYIFKGWKTEHVGYLYSYGESLSNIYCDMSFVAIWEAEDTDLDTGTDTEIFPDVTFNYLIADLDYELKQDDCSELMNAYFELQNTLAVTQGTTQVLATGTLTTNFGAPSGTYNIVLDRFFKYIYFKNIATGQTILKIDSSGYWYYRVYSNQGNAGEYKKLSDYGGEFWFSFTNDDADVFPQVLVINEAVTVLNSAEAGSYESGYMSGLKDGYENGYDKGYLEGYDDGYKKGTEETFLGVFLGETYDKLVEAFQPALQYRLPFLGYSISEIVTFVFSISLAFLIFKVVGWLLGK